MHGEPVSVRGTVRSLHDGKWVEPEARHGGRRQNDQGLTAVLDLGNGNTLVLNSLRTPPFSLGQLTSLGIDFNNQGGIKKPYAASAHGIIGFQFKVTGVPATPVLNWNPVPHAAGYIVYLANDQELTNPVISSHWLSSMSRFRLEGSNS